MHRSRTVLVATLLACALASPAEAGRRRFAWVYDTEVVPQRGVELESWIWERTGETPPEAVLFWSPFIGITDNIEVGLPVEWVWRGEPVGATHFETYGLDLRVRLADADPVNAGPIVPYVRAGVKRVILARDTVRFEGDFVVSLDTGPVHSVVDAGIVADTDSETVLARGGVAASVTVTTDVHAGLEVFGERTLTSPGEDQFYVAVGPSFAFTHGRFWVAASFGIGLVDDGPELLPRVVWGIAF